MFDFELLTLPYHWKVARNSKAFMVIAAVVAQKVNENFAKVYLRNFSGMFVYLKERNNHQKESVRAQTTKVRIVQ